jgi:hypothetical protein
MAAVPWPVAERQGDSWAWPTELVLVAVIAAVVLLVVSSLLLGFGVSPQQGVSFWDLWGGPVTQWADVPLAIVLLGAALLASYQSLHGGEEVGAILDAQEAVRGASGEGEPADEVVAELTSGLRHLRRSRLALVCLALLGLLTAAAAVTHLVFELGDGYVSPSTAWYAKGEFVALAVAAAVPALACVAIAARAWGGGSRPLSRDGPHERFDDEPEHPVEPEPVS